MDSSTGTTGGMWNTRTARHLAVLILLFAFVDGLVMGGYNAWTLASRALWALSMLGYATLSTPGALRPGSAG
jgi:hypothetical protein